MNEEHFDAPPTPGELQGVLRLAVDAIRVVPPPAADFEAWHPRHFDATASLNPTPTTISSNRKKLMHRLAMLAAVVLAAIVVGSLLQIDRAAGTTFAAVIERVHRARSVTCLHRVKDAEPTEPATSKLYIRADAMRAEITGFGVFIFDMKLKKALVLDERSKVAMFPSIIDGAPMPNPLEELSNLRQEDAERLVDEMLDGRQVEVYRLRDVRLMGTPSLGENGADIKLWVNPKTQLPVKFVISPPNEPAVGVPHIACHSEFYDFRWDVELDPGLFSLDVPKGYTVQQESLYQAMPRNKPAKTRPANAPRAHIPPTQPAKNSTVANLISGYSPIIKNTILVAKTHKGWESSTTRMDQPTTNESPPRHIVHVSANHVSYGCQYVGRAEDVDHVTVLDVYLISVKIGDQPAENIPVIYSGGDKVLVDRPEIQLSFSQKAQEKLLNSPPANASPAATPSEKPAKARIDSTLIDGKKATFVGHITEGSEVLLQIGEEKDKCAWTNWYKDAGPFRAVVESSDRIRLDGGSFGEGFVFTCRGATAYVHIQKTGSLLSGRLVFRDQNKIVATDGAVTFADIQKEDGTSLPMMIAIQKKP